MTEKYEIERKWVVADEPSVFKSAISWFIDGVKASLVSLLGGDQVIHHINYMDRIEQKK